MTIEDFYSSFVIRKLQVGDVITSFSCGDEDLDDFLVNDAPLYREALLAVTYIIENRIDKSVAGYFSLAND